MKFDPPKGTQTKGNAVYHHLLRRIQGAIFDSSESIFLPTVVVLSFLLNGIWLSPAATRVFRFAQNPYTNPFRDSSDWLLENYLLPWLAHVFGADGSVLSFAVFNIAFLVFGMLGVYFVAHRLTGREVARSLAVIWLVAPTSLIVLGSIGYADTITVLVASVLAFRRSPLVLTLPLSFAMGLNHWSQGLVMLCLITGANVAAFREERIRRLAWFAANMVALMVGVGVMRAVFSSHGIEPGMNRLDYVANYGAYAFFRSAMKSFGLLFYSTLGVLWLLFYRYLRTSEIQGRVLVAALFLAVLGLSLITPDQTRVYAMLSWPLVVIMIEQLWATERMVPKPFRLKQVVTVTAVLGLMIPKVAIWHGEPYGSLIYHDFLVAVEGIRDPETLRWEDNRWISRAFNR